MLLFIDKICFSYWSILGSEWVIADEVPAMEGIFGILPWQKSTC
jgi:hypothetical protein